MQVRILLSFMVELYKCHPCLQLKKVFSLRLLRNHFFFGVNPANAKIVNSCFSFNMSSIVTMIRIMKKITKTFCRKHSNLVISMEGNDIQFDSIGFLK